jgi:hypothetical protein
MAMAKPPSLNSFTAQDIAQEVQFAREYWVTAAALQDLLAPGNQNCRGHSSSAEQQPA